MLLRYFSFFLSLILAITLFVLPNQVIASSLDEFVQTYSEQRALNIGTNCWATALSAAGVLSYSGYVDSEQFRHWMNSPLCQKLADYDDPKPGDIIAIKSKSILNTEVRLQELHASVFLEKNLVFEKATNSCTDTPLVTPLSESIKPYLENELTLAQARELNAADGTWLSLHRCSSLNSYLEIHHTELIRTTTRFWQQLAREEQYLNDWTFKAAGTVDALRAGSQRLTTTQSNLTQILMYKNSSLVNLNEIPARFRPLVELPDWILWGLLLRLQNMTHQIQLVIGTTNQCFEASQRL